jgi:hypothetical protein
MRTTRLRAIVQLPSLLFRISRHLEKQRKFLSQNIRPVLNAGLSANDGSLNEKDISKINRYYGLAVPAVLGEAFCALRGTAMSGGERWASTCQGAMTGLFDDFFDMQYMDDSEIKNKIDIREQSEDKKSNELLFDMFYDNVLKFSPDPASVKKALTAVYEAQVLSREQTESIPTKRILDISLNKGGTSLQFYRTVFHHSLVKGENDLLFLAGGIMQLGNDIFDVYKDRESGINTLITTCNSINEVRIVFSDLLSKFYRKAQALPYSAANIKKFMDIFSICVFSRCYVCLDHLEKSESTTGNKFVIEAYSRNQLICDMDTKKNMLRSAAYHINTVGQY